MWMRPGGKRTWGPWWLQARMRRRIFSWLALSFGFGVAFAHFLVEFALVNRPTQQRHYFLNQTTVFGSPGPVTSALLKRKAAEIVVAVIHFVDQQRRYIVFIRIRSGLIRYLRFGIRLHAQFEILVRIVLPDPRELTRDIERANGLNF